MKYLVVFMCLLACSVSGEGLTLTTESWDPYFIDNVGITATDTLILDSCWWKPAKTGWIQHSDQWYIKSVDTTVRCDSCPTIKWDGLWAIDFDCLPLKSDSVVRRDNWGVYWITKIDTAWVKKELLWLTPIQQEQLLKILKLDSLKIKVGE